MRKLRYLTAAVTTTALTLSYAAAAGTTYKGLAKDNPDLMGNPQPSVATQAQSSPSKPANVYHGLAKDNSDLVSPIETNKAPTKKDPDIYGEAEPNPDLTY